MTLLQLETEEADSYVRLALSGELDIASAPQVEEALNRIEANQPGLILIDLRGLEFMDSTGLRTVVSADSRAREEGRRLAVVRGPEQVERIFTVTRLNERLEMVDEPGAALTG
jgi:anti-sigma B factor antagonist